MSLHHVHITGTSYACGKTLGELQTEILSERAVEIERLRSEHGLSKSSLSSRVVRFRRNIASVSPHWLEEIEGMSDSSGLSVEDLLLNGCPPDGLFLTTTNNCTTFVAATADQWMLMKIRDERNRLQSVHVQHADGYPLVQIGRDIGNIGAAHVINEYGLAGACNTGSHTDRVGGEPLLNDCHILRYFAENARQVSDIPPLYERLIKAGVAGGAGTGRGAIYILADPCQALILECVADDYCATFLTEGAHVVSNHFLSPEARKWWSRPPNLNTLRRWERMTSLLSRCRGPVPSPTEAFAISRDRKHHPHCLCNDNSKHFWMTVSSHVHCIDRNNPRASLSHVCCGNTRHSLYVPLPLDQEKCFVPHVDGSFSRVSRELYRQGYYGQHMARTQRAFEMEACASGDYLGYSERAHDLLRSFLR